MSKNQLHGKKYENCIKQVFPGSLDVAIDATSVWDIPAEFDIDHSLPTSIKTSRSKIISLADARRFASIDTTFRLIYSQYVQQGDSKIFKIIYEYIMTLEMHKQIMGEYNLENISLFHNELKTFSSGYEQSILARKRAREIKKAYSLKYKSILKLNPKIDSKDQRRLQCSISKDDLDLICVPTVYTEYYKGIPTNIIIESSPREFSQSLIKINS